MGGCAFWGFTGSSKGWIVPSASVAGILLIAMLVKWLKTFIWFAGIVVISIVALALAVLVWKAYQYQKERDFALLLKK